MKAMAITALAVVLRKTDTRPFPSAIALAPPSGG
jgi:hypothetical protein